MTAGKRTAPLVVGVDDSKDARAALRLAAAEASLRKLPLAVVTAESAGFEELTATAPLRGSEGMVSLAMLMFGPETAGAEALAPPLRVATSHRLERIVAEELGPVPQVPIRVETWEGYAGRVLVERAADAPLMAIGAGAHGGLRRRLGSVAQEVVHRAPCPVIVVRAGGGAPRAGGVAQAKVLAGCDAASGLLPGALEVLHFAVAEARLRSATLEIVTVVAPGASGGRGSSRPDEGGSDLAAEISKEVGNALDTDGVRLSVALRRGEPARELVTAARAASLMVIGSARRLHRGPEPRSVHHAVLIHAACPVAVVKAPAPRGRR